MNRYALYHAMDSQYAFPVSEDEMVLRLRTAKNDVDRVTLLYESKYVIGLKHKSAVMKKAYVGRLFDYYEIKLKLKDTRLAYVFYVESGEEKYYFSEDGPTEAYDFSLGYYNFFQYPYINENDIVKPVEWMEKAVFYQIFVDRFNIGDRNKDMSYINLKWGDIPNPKSFAGGDIKGITEKLDYIKGLGADSVYLTPVFESVSNHKYDISDYYRVDSRFGTNGDLKELVTEAHKRGMHIVLDAVFNHVSENLAQFKDVREKGRQSEYFDWFIIHGDKVDMEAGNYEMFASCRYMPKLNTSNPDVCSFLCAIGTYYIREYGIDGWRLDVSDEVSRDFWRTFRKAVKAASPDAVLIGENWHDAYPNLMGDQYDSIMNYAFTKNCLDYFVTRDKTAEEAAWKFNDILMRNKEGINKMMLNLLDSHDTHRFYTRLGKRRDTMRSALALLFFFEGAPCIFYGTEILTEGGFDPDCRRCMDWEKTKKGRGYDDIKALIKALSKMRKEKAFEKSDITVTSENGALVLARRFGKTCYELFINENDSEATAHGNIRISAHSFTILKNGGVYING